MNRNLVLDLLKFFMAFMVVGIHSDLLHDHSTFFSTLLTSYLFRIAVPVFFMINGYFAASALSALSRFGMWFCRVFVLYVVWMAIYLPAYSPFLKTLPLTVQILVLGHFHLWYLIATALAGLMVYGLKRVDEKITWGLMLLTYGVGLFLQYAGSYHLYAGTDFDRQIQPFYIYRNVLTVGFSFFALGAVMARHEAVKRLPVWVGWAFLGCGFLLMGGEFAVNRYNHIRKGFDLLFCLPVAASGLFIVAMQSKLTTKTAYFHQASAVIYLAHPYVLKWLYDGGMKDSVVRWAVAITLCAGATPAVVWLNDRIRSRVPMGFI